MTSEYILFAVFLLLGFVVGASIGISNHIVLFLSKNKVVRFALDLILPIVSGFAFLYLANIYNMGEIRWFFVLAVILGLYIERKTIGKLFAIIFSKLYTKSRERCKIFLSTKFGRWLSK